MKNDKEKVEYELIEIKQKKKKLAIFGIGLAIVLVLVGIIFAKGYKSAENKYKKMVEELKTQVSELSNQAVALENISREVDIDVINYKIQEIGELATYEYMYTDAGKFENPKKIFGKNIPFTTKSFIAKWNGVIKAGVDINEIKAEVDKNNKKIIVHMPKAEILSHEIDEDSVETLDQKDGLLDKASKNAEKIIEKLVNNDAVQELGYNIEFEESK